MRDQILTTPTPTASAIMSTNTPTSKQGDEPTVKQTNTPIGVEEVKVNTPTASATEEGVNVWEGSVPGEPETQMRLTLSKNQIIVGTADKYQDVIDQTLPPFAVFVIYGPVDENINLPWGGWDQFRNATSDFIESEL